MIKILGGNPKTVQFAGINIKKIKIWIYTITGIYAALAGLVLTSRNLS